MPTYTVSPVQVIRENLATILAYAFSIKPLQEFVEASFEGEWQQLRETLLVMPRERAERACLELALFLRYMDDERLIPDPYRKAETLPYGDVFFESGEKEPLPLRQIANKIIHSQSLEWDVSQPYKPKLICVARPNSKDNEGRIWTKAEIALHTLAAICGQLAG